MSFSPSSPPRTPAKLAATTTAPPSPRCRAPGDRWKAPGPRLVNPAGDRVLFGKWSGSEVKIEVLCREEYLLEAVQALREVHPYQEPVINIIPLANSRYGGTA